MFKRFKQIIGAKELVKDQVGNYFFSGTCRWENNNDLKIIDSKKVETIFFVNTYATNSMKLIIESIRGKKEYHLEKFPDAKDSVLILNVVDFDSNCCKSTVMLNEEVAFFRFPNENSGLYFSKDDLTQTEFINRKRQTEKETINSDKQTNEQIAKNPLEDLLKKKYTIEIINMADLENVLSVLKYFNTNYLSFKTNQIVLKNFKIDRKLILVLQEIYEFRDFTIELFQCDLSDLRLFGEIAKAKNYKFTDCLEVINDDFINLMKKNKVYSLDIQFTVYDEKPETNNYKEKINSLARLKDLSDLCYLGLSGFGFNCVPRFILDMPQLISLDLNDNYISNISNEINCLHNLEILNLSENELETLPPELGLIPNLTDLYLTNNNLSFIPLGLKKIKLKTLWIEKNNLPPELLESYNEWFETIDSFWLD